MSRSDTTMAGAKAVPAGKAPEVKDAHLERAREVLKSWSYFERFHKRGPETAVLAPGAEATVPATANP